MGICHKHGDEQEKYYGTRLYKYQGESCDWCERLADVKKDELLLESGKRIRVVVSRSNHPDTGDGLVSVQDRMREVEAQYPGFVWAHAGQFMDTYGFSTMMNQEEIEREGLA